MAKYNRIGRGYNETRKADPFLTQRLLALLSPERDGTYLDIGCGTGNYTIQLSKSDAHFIGVDPSEHMLKIAMERSDTIKWLVGKVEDIPLNDNSVDGIVGTLTIHHWKDMDMAFKELKRVSKPNSKIVLFTSTPEQMKGYWLNAYFPKMLEDSMRQMPSFEMVSDVMKQHGFGEIRTERYFVKEDLEDFFLYAGKHRPELYLDPDFRRGISSFSDLANIEEVERGLAKLENDISSGEIYKVIREYENEVGDYLFLSA